MSKLLKPIFFVFLVSLFSINCLGQSRQIFEVQNVIIESDTCLFCKVIRGDTINCVNNKRERIGFWKTYKSGLSWHTDFCPPEEYEEFYSYAYFLQSGIYKNDIKIRNWITYYPPDKNEHQRVEKITNYNKQGIRDSTELIFYPDSTIITKLFWNNGINDSICIYDNERLVLRAKYRNQYELESFTYFDFQKKNKYFWNYNEDRRENFILLMDSLGTKHSTYRKEIYDVISDFHYMVFSYSF